MKQIESNPIDSVRQSSRQLVRELGMLQLDKPDSNKTPSHWHALIEISQNPQMTVSQLGKQLVLSISATSRVVTALEKAGLISYKNGADKRVKYLELTERGQSEIGNVDEFTNYRIKGALEYLSEGEMEQIIQALNLYSNALKKSREVREEIKISTLSTSRTIRGQVVEMIEAIQKDEFKIPVTDEINAGVLKAEEEYYYYNSCNFWYATDKKSNIIGSIGLKKIDDTSCELKKCFVAKPYRSKGVARKLMQTLIKAAKKHEFTKIYLGTVDKLKAAQRFYSKQGFFAIEKSQLPKAFSACHLDTVFLKGDVETIHDKLSRI